MKKLIVLFILMLSFGAVKSQTLTGDRGVFRDSIQLNGVWITAEKLEQCPYVPYELPIATPSELGGVRIGNGLSINGSGILSADVQQQYVLPQATGSVLGGVKVGSGLTINGSGVLSATGGGGGSGTDSSILIERGLTKSINGNEIKLGIDSTEVTTRYHLEENYPDLNQFNSITTDTVIQMSGSGKVLGNLNLHINPNVLFSSVPTDSTSVIQSWGLKVNGLLEQTIEDGDDIDLVAGSGMSLTYSGGQLTFASTGGGGGGSQDLQSVTDEGSTTTNSIKVKSGSDSIYLDNSGDIVISGSITAAGGGYESDIRLKDTSSYKEESIIEKLNTVSYTWKNKKDSLEHVGYVAQEIQKIMPDAVNKGSNGYYNVNYTEVHTAAIHDLYELVRKQQKEIENLKEEIKNLK